MSYFVFVFVFFGIIKRQKHQTKISRHKIVVGLVCVTSLDDR